MLTSMLFGGPTFFLETEGQLFLPIIVTIASLNFDQQPKMLMTSTSNHSS
jgi:hypothetical protein